ncbi:50S ribosomal protein L15 [Phragmitibacter flavus]|uniref:Large ribosomal subunit protein uL15 n=1 Tax=Phragmitibacter flavus TaxID=2576071 RepID=A0A5R8KA00_9BACT|nr:50S ribosomal protein L15 [Phragmitibacter flavus]TLD69138.1 50S ribosomal protein L15 [Phragmitibacter flavus]
MSLRLHNLKTAKGSKHRRKRVGCGESSGHGKTSGRGHKGQKARSGSAIRPGFEGGQMPLHRRLPKKGFNNTQFQDTIATVNVRDLIRFEDGATVNEQTLRECGLVRGEIDAIKLLGNGDLTLKLNIEVDKISASAKEKVEKAGGTVTLKA